MGGVAPAPTTGLAAMLLLLKLCRAVTLFGMGGAEEAEYHYYDMGHGTVIKRGFRTHNFHLERLLVRCASPLRAPSANRECAIYPK
jgi:hypothetical protein